VRTVHTTQRTGAAIVPKPARKANPTPPSAASGIGSIQTVPTERIDLEHLTSCCTFATYDGRA